MTVTQFVLENTANVIASTITFMASICGIIGLYLSIKRDVKRSRVKPLVLFMVISLAAFAISASSLYKSYKNEHTPTPAAVILSNTSLTLNCGESSALSANVVYSDESSNSKVVWESTDSQVVAVADDGTISAKNAGSAVVVATAVENPEIKAECIITVVSTLTGYDITLSTERARILESFYIYIEPYESDFETITVYAKAPSGQVYVYDYNYENPKPYLIDTEIGSWTIYASIKNSRSEYMAGKAGDFAQIEIEPLFN